MPSGGVHAVPAGPQGKLVRAQLARVEEPVHLHPLEHRGAERAELLGAVLAQVEGVVGLVRAGRGQGEQVRGGEVHGAAGAEQRAEVHQHLLGALHVLDRLQEHHRVHLLAVVLHQVAHEADARARVLEAGVLMSVRVGVHPGDHARATGQHLGAVALAAGHVHHLQAVAAIGDPLVHGQVAPVPVVLRGHVGHGPLAGQGERRDPVGLVPLNGGFAHAGRVYGWSGAQPGHRSGLRSSLERAWLSRGRVA